MEITPLTSGSTQNPNSHPSQRRLDFSDSDVTINGIAFPIIAGENAQTPTANVVVQKTVDQVEASFQEEFGPLFTSLIQMLANLNFSREYHRPQRRFPLHAEFAPFIDEILSLFKKYSKWKIENRDQLKLCVNLFNKQMQDFVIRLSSKIKNDACTSLGKQKEYLVTEIASALVTYVIRYQMSDYERAANDVFHDSSIPSGNEGILQVIQTNIKEFEDNEIERSLVELKRLLNVERLGSDRKANNNEIRAFKLLQSFYTKNKTLF